MAKSMVEELLCKKMATTTKENSLKSKIKAKKLSNFLVARNTMDIL